MASAQPSTLAPQGPEGRPPVDIEATEPIAFWPAAPSGPSQHHHVRTRFEQPLAPLKIQRLKCQPQQAKYLGMPIFNQRNESLMNGENGCQTQCKTLIHSNMVGERDTHFIQPKTCGSICVISLENPRNDD